MAELVFEIGCEELPAGFIAPAVNQLAELIVKALANASLPHGPLQPVGSPRRLGVIVRELAEAQPDITQTITGPPASVAFDDQGNPTKAAIGFARSKGVTVEQLKVIQTPKGPYCGFTRLVKGRSAREILAEILPGLVKSLSFPKTMRWGSGSLRFARPIHWLLAVLDGQVVEFELEGIRSGAVTYGHRFLAPGPIQISSADQYLKALREAFVFAERTERRQRVLEEVQSAARAAGGQVLKDEELVEEVTDLVEWPVACAGQFKPEFLEIPRAVIVCAMREHQRYFALEDAQGQLMPAFVAVNNTQPKDMAVVRAGHERVLNARLADARFFFEEDRRRPLGARVEELKEVTYHSLLGTSYEKVARFTRLALTIGRWLELEPQTLKHLERACWLSKCDLLTEMVGEFPSLQGIIGEEYALMDGEDPAVARAIREHYLPQSAEGPLPEAIEGTIVGLADRLDSLCGYFGVGLKPTATADPYGLRRAAIGVIRLVAEKDLTLSLKQMLDTSLEQLWPWLKLPVDEVKQELEEFFAARLQALLTDRGVPADVASAVIAAGIDDLSGVVARAEALAEVRHSEQFLPLARGLKRVMNILRKEAHQLPKLPPDPSLLVEPQEKALYKAFSGLEARAQKLFEQGLYREFLSEVAALKGPIDEFFDHVLVICPDEKLRANRLALLKAIGELFERFAIFTHLQLA